MPYAPQRPLLNHFPPFPSTTNHFVYPQVIHNLRARVENTICGVPLRSEHKSGEVVTTAKKAEDCAGRKLVQKTFASFATFA
jgi:hypothetical protein